MKARRCCGLLKRAAIPEIRHDPGRAKRVIAILISMSAAVVRKRGSHSSTPLRSKARILPRPHAQCG